MITERRGAKREKTGLPLAGDKTYRAINPTIEVAFALTKTTMNPYTLHDEILAQQANALANGRMITYTEAKEEIHKAWDRERILELLNRLTDEERLDIFFEYCRACGSKDPKCQCWNDE